MRTNLLIILCVAASSAMAQTSGVFQQGAIYVVHSATRRTPQNSQTGLAAGSLCDINIAGLYQPYGTLSPNDPVTIRFRPPDAGGARDMTILAAQSFYLGVPTQFTALVPPGTAAGQAELLAVAASGSSFSTAVWVAASDFGIFTKSGTGYDAAVAQVWGDTVRTVGLATPALAGEWVTLWGTGLGSAAASTVSVGVGGIRVAPAYAGAAPGLPGVDQINFQFPAGLPDDCYLPVAVKIGGRAGKMPAIAAAGSPGPCHHRLGLPAGALATLDHGGLVPLTQSWVHSDVIPTPAAAVTYRRFDTVSMDFMQYDAPGIQVMTGLWTAPAAGCQLDLGGNIGGILVNVPPLDSGTPAVIGPGGLRMTMDGSFGHYSTTPPDATYALDGIPASSFVPGSWSVEVPGGKDIAPFQARLRVPPALRWTNRATLSPVSSTSDLLLNWDPTGYSDREWMQGNIGSGAASVVCQAPATAGSIAIPASLITQLPADATTFPTVQLLLRPASRNPDLYTVPLVGGGFLPGLFTFSYLEAVSVALL